MQDKVLFNTVMRGFDKEQVTEYIDSIVQKYNKVIADAKIKNDGLAKAYDELLAKYERAAANDSDYLIEKATIADTLISAQNTANRIVEAAKIDAEAEKARLLIQAEAARELIVDRNNEIREYKNDLKKMLDGFRISMEKIFGEMEESFQSFSQEQTNVEEKYIQ